MKKKKESNSMPFWVSGLIAFVSMIAAGVFVSYSYKIDNDFESTTKLLLYLLFFTWISFAGCKIWENWKQRKKEREEAKQKEIEEQQSE